MSKLLRSTNRVPSSGILLAAIVLASCGADTGAATAAPVAPDASAIEAAEPATPASAEPAVVQEPETPLKAAAEPAAAPAFIGRWGIDLAQCSIAQESEGAPMILRADGYDQHEAHCDFDSVNQTGPGQWHVTGQCDVEGDAQPIDDNFAIVDGNLEQWSGDRKAGVWTLVRCPG
ncbi:hypothetical protein [uncultured Maricaulis sp.]|uniref:hypothetical protein n=1 Tax=uncultured Maricaulis sp. TaxID=174710 RepID=UPI0030D9F612|tara:strand:- start:42704 stop:43228 length:525 start_codon:yes stop_codon:yes gene_type:complete